MLKRILPILLILLITLSVSTSASSEEYFIATMIYENIFINVEVVNDRASIHIKNEEEDIRTNNAVNSSEIIADFIRIFSIVGDTEVLDNTDNYVELEYSFMGESKQLITHNIDEETAMKIYDEMLKNGNASVFANVIKTLAVMTLVIFTIILLFLTRKTYDRKTTRDTKNDAQIKNVEKHNDNNWVCFVLSCDTVTSNTQKEV